MPLFLQASSLDQLIALKLQWRQQQAPRTMYLARKQIQNRSNQQLTH